MFFMRCAIATIFCGMRLHMAIQAFSSVSSVNADFSSLFVISTSASAAFCLSPWRKRWKVMPSSSSFNFGAAEGEKAEATGVAAGASSAAVDATRSAATGADGL